MSSLFANTHNMVAILQKSDAAEGFEQIIDFLSGCYIHYALTMNPHIYISCIKQFWNTAFVKRSNDVTRLQALVNKKKIMISEDVIREILQLDDAEGVNQIGDLSTHTTRYISPALTQKVFANMRRVGKGFSGVETPLFVGMLAAREIAEEGIAEEQVQADNAVATAVQETVAEDVANEAIPSTPLILQSPPSHEQSSPPPCCYCCYFSNVVTAATSQVSAASATISAAKPNIPAAAPTVVAAYTRRRKGVIIRDPEEELSSKTLAETPKLKEKGKGILIETPKPMKKKDQIELDAEYAGKLHEEINKDHEEINKDIDWDAAIDHKAAKRRKLNKQAQEVEDLKKHLEVVNDEDDDIFTEATPLGRKNFDREDLEDLWRIVKERFSTSKPSNFSDDYLLTTLKIIFEKPDGQDVVWGSQSIGVVRDLLGDGASWSTVVKEGESVNSASSRAITSAIRAMTSGDGGTTLGGGVSNSSNSG
nr:hypothetical protein [Tanacetum cinerariifolium]